MTMTSRTLRRTAIALLWGAAPTVAFAHPGHGEASGLVQGLLHPLLGLDHLLAMVLVGVLAYQIRGRALYAVPGTFFMMMLAGGFLGTGHVGIPYVELGIAVSVIALGAIVAFDARLPAAVAAALAGLFAVFHGYAHGLEMPVGTSGTAYAAGFISATASLHGGGMLLARFVGLWPQSGKVMRFAAAGAAFTGFSFLPLVG